jgi:hypothetical protein
MSRRLLTTLIMAATALALPATAAARDRNHDRIPDRWERAHHLSLRVNQAPRDQDRDGLNNLNEWKDHTDPRKPDSDGDGTADGLEDGDGDHVNNVLEQEHGVGSDKPQGGDRQPGSPGGFDHVVSYVDGSGVLTLGRADGSTVTAGFGGHVLLACSPVVAGPFQPCPPGALKAGAPVAVGALGEGDSSPAWRAVLLLVAPAHGTGTGDSPVHAETPAPLPPAPSGDAAPPVTATVVSFDGGVLKIHRPNGEEPSMPIAAGASVNCISVAAGVVVAKGACGAAEHLAPGTQLALAAPALVDGGYRWTKLYIIVPA